MRLLQQPDIIIPVTRRSLENSITFPLSAEHIRIVLNNTSRDLLNAVILNPSSLEHFIFLPGAVDNMEHQLEAFRFIIRWSVVDKFSFHFVSALDHHGINLANVRIENLLFGGGGIDILDEIILPNVHRLLYVDCILSLEAHSRFRSYLPDASLQVVEDINVTFVSIGTQPASTLIIHTRYSFGHVDPPPCLPPLDTMSHLRVMKKIDMGSLSMSPDVFMAMARLSCDTLMDAFFYVTFVPESTLQTEPIIMRKLTKLRIRLIDTSNNSNFVNLIHLPAIRSLWVEWGDNNFPFKWDLALYTRWLSYSSNTLTQLLLTDFPLSNRIQCGPNQPQSDNSKLEALFRMLPNLKSLSLPPGIHVVFPILVQLATGSLLPCLNSLSISTNGGSDDIFNMVHLRNEAGLSSGYSPIMALNMVTTSLRPAARRSLHAKLEALNLPRSYRLQFLKPCTICNSYCYFDI
ncbi:hypothetical protein CPB84DRAFT_1848977 [Gymnopilus junonius]|uniref:Uncharacterized protein n=1 Tax=Gymnopilus junonius TaxID=109634 RepID=A0A9P5TLJ3_GYMJU|nr:hypothetical protein CPB84DRAFT_1848977 [Gymnopilus junonius]